MKIEKILDFLNIRPLTTWESLIIGHIVVIVLLILCVYLMTSYHSYIKGWEEDYFDRAKEIKEEKCLKK